MHTWDTVNIQSIELILTASDDENSWELGWHRERKQPKPQKRRTDREVDTALGRLHNPMHTQRNDSSCSIPYNRKWRDTVISQMQQVTLL